MLFDIMMYTIAFTLLLIFGGGLVALLLGSIVFFIVVPICELCFCLGETIDDFRAWRRKRKSNPAP